MVNDKRVREILESKKGGLEWLIEAAPVMMAVVGEVKETEERLKEEAKPFKEMLEEATREFKTRLTKLQEWDGRFRERVGEEYEEDESIAFEGVGTIVVTQPWTFDIIDPDKVPREYLMVDGGKVREDIKKGVRKIKGLSIHQGRVLQFRPAKSTNE